jgi:hypothetical protein
MARIHHRGDAGPSADEIERYRRAAQHALEQLDWAIAYLHGLGKTDIWNALARNRSYIRRRLNAES